MPLQIRRGTAAERNAIPAPLAIGELLYVTDQGKLYIGDGTALGGADLVGTPGEGGKGLIITGFTAEEAQDATAVMFSNGTHTNISFTYDDSGLIGQGSFSATVDLTSYQGIIGADVKGSIFGQDSTLLVDAVDSSIPYSVLSGAPTALSSFTNDVGYIRVSDIADGTVTIDVNNTGDLQGSVYGDDSTLLVDATNSNVPASVISGTITNDITSVNVEAGTLKGLASSTLVVETTTRFTSDVVVENEFFGQDGTLLSLSVPNLFNVSNIRNESSAGVAVRSDTQSTNFRIVNEQNDITPPSMAFIKQRGPDSNILENNTGDNLGFINFVGYQGGSYKTGSRIISSIISADGTNIPSRIIFDLADNNGNFEPLLVLTSGGATFTSNEYSFVQNLVNFDQFHDTADAKNVGFRRGRGTQESKSPVQIGDDLIDIGFSGFAGPISRESVGAGINVVVDGPVEDTGLIGRGHVPTKIIFTTQNGPGGLQERVIINKTGLVQFKNGLTNDEILIDNNKISTTNSNTDIELDPAGTGTVDFMVAEQSTVGAAGGANPLPASPTTYFKIKVNGTTYVVPAFAVA